MPDQHRLRFTTVKFHDHQLDQRTFSSVTEEHQAIHDLMAKADHPALAA